MVNFCQEQPAEMKGTCVCERESVGEFHVFRNKRERSREDVKIQGDVLFGFIYVSVFTRIKVCVLLRGPEVET